MSLVGYTNLFPNGNEGPAFNFSGSKYRLAFSIKLGSTTLADHYIMERDEEKLAKLWAQADESLEQYLSNRRRERRG